MERTSLGWSHPTNTRRSADVGTMLAHRLRRWANIVPTLAERLVFTGWCLQLLFRADFQEDSGPGGAGVKTSASITCPN